MFYHVRLRWKTQVLMRSEFAHRIEVKGLGKGKKETICNTFFLRKQGEVQMLKLLAFLNQRWYLIYRLRNLQVLLCIKTFSNPKGLRTLYEDDCYQPKLKPLLIKKKILICVKKTNWVITVNYAVSVGSFILVPLILLLISGSLLFPLLVSLSHSVYAHP